MIIERMQALGEGRRYRLGHDAYNAFWRELAAIEAPDEYGFRTARFQGLPVIWDGSLDPDAVMVE